ncbi:hypothetical protein HY382_00155 [Candidatus Curtissbacteria bacterium]|nr:hypothetical protein [Candidatus Curtissbacteria bacterium]
MDGRGQEHSIIRNAEIRNTKTSLSYNDFRLIADLALSNWLTHQPELFATADTLTLLRLKEEQDLPQIDKETLEKVWKVRSAWMKQIRRENDIFPKDQEFKPTKRNQSAILFMIDMLKNDPHPAAVRLKGWVAKWGITLPLEKVQMPDDFIEQISVTPKNYTAQRAIAKRKVREEIQT